MIRRLSAACLLLLSVAVLYASGQDLEKRLQEMVSPFLSYVPQGTGDLSLSVTSLDINEVSWSDRDLAEVQLMFTCDGQTLYRTLMFLVDEQEPFEKQAIAQLQGILPEVAQSLFDLDAQGMTVIAPHEGPLLTQGDEARSVRAGDLLTVNKSDGTLLATLRVESEDEDVRYLALEWAQRPLVDHMVLTPWTIRTITVPVTVSGTYLSLSPSFTVKGIPSPYLSFHAGAHLKVPFDSSALFVAPMAGITGEILLTQVFPGLEHHVPVSRFSVRGTVDFGYGVSVSSQVQSFVYSEITGGISYRWSPFLACALGLSYRVQDSPRELIYAASLSLEVRL